MRVCTHAAACRFAHVELDMQASWPEMRDSHIIHLS